MAGERVAVGGEGLVQFGPVLGGQQLLGQRHDLLFLQRHVLEVEVGVLLRRLLEGLAARLAHHLEAQQRVLQVADGAFAAGMVLVEAVEHLVGLGGARAQLREQQLRFLQVVALLGKLVHVEQHRAQRREVGQRALAAVLRQQQQDRTQHGRQGGMFIVDDAQRGV